MLKLPNLMLPIHRSIPEGIESMNISNHAVKPVIRSIPEGIESQDAEATWQRVAGDEFEASQKELKVMNEFDNLEEKKMKHPRRNWKTIYILY